jgi:hypothetical protein
MLLERLIEETERWQGAFARDASHHRAVEHLLASACTMGRRTVSRSIIALGRDHQDWSADYKLYARSPWEQNDLFEPVFHHYVRLFSQPGDPIGVALDDTKLSKTGRDVPHACWHRDPLSPPFHTNLLFGLRFLQASLLFPHHQTSEIGARGVPVRFTEVPHVKKPGKKATEQDRADYKAAIKTQNLSMAGVAMIEDLRKTLDRHGASLRPLVMSMDGSFCNKTIFSHDFERTVLLARVRKDARLCLPAEKGSRKTYSPERFTPQSVRQNENIPYQTAQIFYGGTRREIRFKQVSPVLWQRGSRRKPLRLIVVAPQPYRVSPNALTSYRDPAYLLTTDLTTPVALLLQIYFDRWQIEVNHREEKSTLGVGQAQLTSSLGVPRQPAFLVAGYSMILLASILEFGPHRTKDLLPLPKWRRNAKRPSLLDLLSLLRTELDEAVDSKLDLRSISANLRRAAYT